LNNGIYIVCSEVRLHVSDFATLSCDICFQISALVFYARSQNRRDDYREQTDFFSHGIVF